jgi:hypothetical protein
MEKQMGLGPLKFTDEKGNFAGIENMITEFDKLNGLDATRLNAVLKALFGGGQDQVMVATMIANGMEGYKNCATSATGSMMRWSRVRRSRPSATI